MPRAIISNPLNNNAFVMENVRNNKAWCIANKKIYIPNLDYVTDFISFRFWLSSLYKIMVLTLILL